MPAGTESGVEVGTTTGEMAGGSMSMGDGGRGAVVWTAGSFLIGGGVCSIASDTRRLALPAASPEASDEGPRLVAWESAEISLGVRSATTGPGAERIEAAFDREMGTGADRIVGGRDGAMARKVAGSTYAFVSDA